MASTRTTHPRPKRDECNGKRAYLTFTQAEQARKRYMMAKDSTGATSSYRCSHCQKFHYGHTPWQETRRSQRERRERRRAHDEHDVQFEQEETGRRLLSG